MGLRAAARLPSRGVSRENEDKRVVLSMALTARRDHQQSSRVSYLYTRANEYTLVV